MRGRGDSILEQRVEDRIGDQGEDEIIEAEQQQILGLRTAVVAVGEQRLGGLRGGDDDRHEQGQRQQRADEVARARLDGQRGGQGGGRRDGAVGRGQDGGG